MKNWIRFQSVKAGLLLLLVAVCALFSAPTYAQRSGGVNSSGTDYWITFMPNYLNPADNIRLFVASGTVNKVQVDVYGGSKYPQQHFTQQMQPDKVWTLSFPSTRLVEERVQEVPEYKAIHVTSQNPIAVYGLSNVYTTTDSYLAIPTPALGTEYFPACMYDDNYNELGLPDPLAGEFVIIAPYDKTFVTIGPVATDTRSDPSGTISHPQGSSWTIELQQGQTYLVQSTGLKPGDGDLTGTHVTSTKPIGVISGHQRCRMPVDGHGNSKDHIMEMMIPVDKWGTQYFDMPQGGRLLCGNYIRLIAGEDGCYITENGQGIAQLNKGEWVDRDLVLDPVVYTSNGKKFAVVEYSYSQNFNGDPIQSDPFEIIMTPQNQFQKKMIFRVPNNVAAGTEYDNFGTFIAIKDSVNRIIINGKRITGYTFAGQADFPNTSPQMSAYRIKFPDQTATYVATCGAPFGCYIYGFSYAESYGHPAGMALNVTSPDTLPPLQALKDSACGDFHIKLNEPRLFPAFSFDDTRIADIAMISDPSDFRWPKISNNYRFEWDPNHPFTSGDSVAYFYLRIIDGGKPGYAAIWTTDRAGNDTVYEYNYTAPNVDGAPSPLIFDSVWAMAPGTIKNFVLRNHQNGNLTISNITIVGSAVGGKFELVTDPGNVTIKPNDSLVLQIRFTALDTVTSFDTLKLNVNDCLPFQYVLQGTGMIPQIVADDVNFGSVNVGDTVCKLLNVRNVGKLPFILTKQWLLNNSKEFSFADDVQLPMTLAPGHSVALNFCFHPDTIGAVQGRQDWGTNELAPYAHSIKDTSSLLGFGRSPGLEWDRPTQDYTVQCDSQIIRMNLVNSSPQSTGASVEVSNVQIVGLDAADFTIVGTQVNNFPWQIDPAARLWVDVQFKPNMSKGYVARTARLVASGSSSEKTFQPEIALSGVIRHSTLRIVPTVYDFGKVLPGSTMDTDVWIHNDGDTDLVLTNVSIDGGFSIVGFTADEKVLPRDSVKVTVHRDQAALGAMAATLSTSNDASCTPSMTATFRGFSSVFHALSTGYDYNNVYVCRDSSGAVTVQNTGTENARLVDVRIVDTLGASGASQFTFDNGTQKMLGAALDTGKSMTFNVKYNPSLPASSATAWIVYHLYIPSLDKDTVLLQMIKGTGLHYANTVTARNSAGDNEYHAIIGNDVMVPVRLTSAFDPNAKIFGFTYQLRYKRDMFNIEQIVALAGLTGSTASPTVAADPTDVNYEILTVKQTSSSPITTIDTVAKVYFKYVLNKDNSSTIDVSNVAFFDQNGNTACWVDPSNEPGVFTGSDVCGDLTIRNWLNGIPPSWIKAVRPNPMSGTNATIEYGTNVNGTPVMIELFDLLGKKIATVVNDQASTAGDHVATIDGASLNGGTYVLRLSAGLATESMRFVVTK